MSWPRRRSDSGCSATRRSSSPTSSPSRPQREVGVDAILERGEAELLEPADLGLRPRLVGEVGERRPAPERKASRRPAAAACGSLPPGFDHETLEAVEIETIRLDDELVARRPRLDHVATERLRGAGRRTSAGSSAPWPAGGRPRDPRSDGRAKPARPRAAAGSRGARAAWLRPAERPAISDRFDRTEDAELHRAARAERSTPWPLPPVTAAPPLDRRWTRARPGLDRALEGVDVTDRANPRKEESR